MENSSAEEKLSDIGGETKLVLYTSGTNTGNRKKAFTAGADYVVLESPHASKLIDTVIRMPKRD